MIKTKSRMPLDRLSLLRAKYTAQLRAKKSELVALEQKLALIDELESESVSLGESETNSKNGHYSGMNLTNAVLDAVNESTVKLTVGAVKKRLLTSGWIPKGKNFHITVAKTLQRLHEQGKLETDLRSGKRIYWKTEKPPRYELVATG